MAMAVAAVRNAAAVAIMTVVYPPVCVASAAATSGAVALARFMGVAMAPEMRP